MKTTIRTRNGSIGGGLPRELAHRTGDGFEVVLLWHQEEGRDRLQVLVEDTRSGESLVVEVRSKESALDVFYHPFGYAASRGIDTRAFVPRATMPVVSAAL